MRKIFLFLAFYSIAKNTIAQNVGIGTAIPNANAALEIKSNTKGLLMPRLSTTAINNMSNVAKGMLVYDTTKAGFFYHDGGKWLPINQSNNDSLLRYTYPGVAPTIASMPTTNAIEGSTELYGTLYDNGGPLGNYQNNSNCSYIIFSTYDSAVLIRVEVTEMNLESPYDSLEIYSNNDYAHKLLFTGNRTGTFLFRADSDLEFRFHSNSVNNVSGFKINWTRITTNSLITEQPPLTGWYFNTAKLAARGGVNINNNWATNNLGFYSFAFGLHAIAKGDHANAIGQNAIANGIFSIALGQNNNALGIYSTAIGNDNNATSFSTTAIGEGNKVSGNYATALGVYNEVNTFRSLALGAENKLNANYGIAIGNGLIGDADYSIVLGRYNTAGNLNRIFEIGNGTSYTSRSNALTILKDGNTGIGTTNPITKLDVEGGIRTKYSGSVIKSVTGTGSAAFVNLTIPALPADWDFTNTLVMVSVADGVSGIIYQTKLTSATNIQLFFEANAIGPTRFNYIIFKL
jgi:CUB domain/Head domain of trimeric autotransporter adhesin